MIETKGLTKKYKDLVAADHIDMQVEEGDVYGFIGPNGAGKTTTLRMLATLLPVTSGDGFIDGLSIVKKAKKIRYLIGYMPDFFGVYEEMKVSEYLDFFASAYRIGGGERKRIVSDVLALTDLTYKADDYIRTLSRGMQQRLGLARVLIHDPKVLLLDEPASGLDPRARIEIRELIRELRNMGKTIVISSHILSELGEICNKIGIIEKGKLVFQGDLREVLAASRDAGTVYVRVDEPLQKARNALLESEHVQSAEIEEDKIKVTLAPEAPDAGFISDFLVSRGFGLNYMKEKDVDLEDVFMILTKGTVN